MLLIMLSLCFTLQKKRDCRFTVTEQHKETEVESCVWVKLTQTLLSVWVHSDIRIMVCLYTERVFKERQVAVKAIWHSPLSPSAERIKVSFSVPEPASNRCSQRPPVDSTIHQCPQVKDGSLYYNTLRVQAMGFCFCRALSDNFACKICYTHKHKHKFT